MNTALIPTATHQAVNQCDTLADFEIIDLLTEPVNIGTRDRFLLKDITMNDWQQFLTTYGATFTGDLVTSFGESAADYPALTTTNLLMDLSSLAVVSLRGVGADKLLQGQTTCDLRSLSAMLSLLGAQCTPKGRVIANFRIVSNGAEEILLIVPADQAEMLMSALAKYAPFFKTKLSLANDRFHLFGISGDNANQVASNILGDTATTVDGVVKSSAASSIKLSGNRYLLLVEQGSQVSLWSHLAQHLTPVGNPLWQLLAIRAGEADVVAATCEVFVPQMLNMQALGAISFKKGCYTGQEVVARMHYLGKLKRRMYHLKISSSTAFAPGTGCQIPGKTQAAGNVVNAVVADANHVELLVVLTDVAAQSATLQFGDTAPQTINLLPLPYSLEKK